MLADVAESDQQTYQKNGIDDDDPIIHTIDVFNSKSLADHLYLIQHPMRPAKNACQSSKILSALVKPKQCRVQLDVALDTSSNSYDVSKGEALATSSHKNGEQAYRSGLMDKLMLTSSTLPQHRSCYAIGILNAGQLHLTSLRSAVQLRPSFSYLDRSRTTDQSSRGAQNEAEEEQARAITVRFARPESEWARAQRMASFQYHQDQQAQEEWVKLDVHHQQDALSVVEKDNLFCVNVDRVVLEEGALHPREYLHELCPPVEEGESEHPSEPSHVLSLTTLKTLPLNQQVLALLINAKVIRYSQLLGTLLEANNRQTQVLRLLPEYAWLIQGCWVVKSEHLYPKGKPSPHNGVTVDVLCRARDYMLWRFTQSRFLKRQDITAVIKLPTDALQDILTQVARQGRQGWEFNTALDEEFNKRHGELVTKQQQLMETCYNKLCAELNIVSEAHVGRKRTLSTSADSSAGRGATEVGGRRRGRRTASPRRKSQENPLDTAISKAAASDAGAARAIKMEVDLTDPEKAAALGLTPAGVKVAEHLTNLASQAASKSQLHPQAADRESHVRFPTTSSRIAGPPPSAGRLGSAKLSSDRVPTQGSSAPLSFKEEPMALDPGVVETVTVDHSRSTADSTGFFSSLSAAVASANATVPVSTPMAHYTKPAARLIKQEKGMIDTAPELINTLVAFLQGILRRGVLSLRGIKEKLTIEQISNPNSPLAKGVPDEVFVQTLHTAGVVCLPAETGNDQLCALLAVGDPDTDKYRRVILHMFESERGLKRRKINVTLEKELGYPPITRDVNRVLRDLGHSRDGQWFLEEPSSS